MLNVSSYSFLIAIASRKLVAHLFGKPIYLVTDVAIIPLSSQQEAENALRAAVQASTQEVPEDPPGQQAVSDLVDDADNASLTSLGDTWLEDKVPKESRSRSGSGTISSTGDGRSSTGVAQNVIGRKGAYGRFAERWFSRRGWTSGQQRNMGMTSHVDLPPLKSPPHSRRTSAAAPPATEPSQRWNETETATQPHVLESTVISGKTQPSAHIIEGLLPKLLQTLKLLLMSNMFYFSYDYDITRRCGTQHASSSDAALYRQCDTRYFWNSNLIDPFVEEGLDEFILPIMQGFIGQRAFTVDTNKADLAPRGSLERATQVVDASNGKPSSIDETVNDAHKGHQPSFLLTLISRRSTRRAGFRYMRRGIDQNGNVANFVETEQILSSPTWNDQNLYSFSQIRGSIPLFYTQTPYTFKPPPMLHGSRDANQRAFKLHFSNLADEYGPIQAVSLIDRHGGELSVGNAYQDHVDLLNNSGGVKGHPLTFEWFDFHNVCRGMKFENVSILIDSLEPTLKTIGWSTLNSSGTKRLSSQSGTIRTNCMDCLDRTNVVQSAIAQHVLGQQLDDYLSSSPVTLHSDPTSEAFNSLWADNGDAISLTYAGTAALKGDYVRTRRRNLAGLLTDFSLTLSRYYRNLFDDFFAQAVLDFALGNANEAIFTEFQEQMTTADPAIDLSQARQSAITTATHVIVDEKEDLLGGWTLASPASSPSIPTEDVILTTLRAHPFREVLLLLTDVAIYIATYDWDTEKVRAFERVNLVQLTRLQRGIYITQTLTPGQRDPERNVGILIEFEQRGQPAIRRTNTRTVGGAEASADVAASPEIETAREGAGRKVWALKAVPPPLSVPPSGTPSHDPDASETVRQVCREIHMAVSRHCKGNAAPTVPGKKSHTTNNEDTEKRDELLVEERDIVSLKMAEKETGMLEYVAFGLKRLVWG